MNRSTLLLNLMHVHCCIVFSCEHTVAFVFDDSCRWHDSEGKLCPFPLEKKTKVGNKGCRPQKPDFQPQKRLLRYKRSIFFSAYLH